MEEELKDKLASLYASGKSMWEISQELDCSVHKISYWMSKYNVPKRNRSDAMYKKLNPDGDPFDIKTNLSIYDQFLFGLALGIYWGEGNKSDRHAVRVTNTDPEMLLTFREFLRKICHVKESKISYSIVAFNDSNIESVSKYWSKKLKVQPTKFGKIVQILPQGKGSYKRKSQFGVCSISFGNIKLKEWIMNKIFIARPDSSTAERALGKG